MDAEEAVVLGMTVLILAGVAVLWMAMSNRRRFREMEHRERLAMIDRGLIPPPEVDPDGFERRAGLTPVESHGRGPVEKHRGDHGRAWFRVDGAHHLYWRRP